MGFKKAKENIKKKEQAVTEAESVLRDIEKLNPELAKRAKKVIDDMVSIQCGGG